MTDETYEKPFSVDFCERMLAHNAEQRRLHVTENHVHQFVLSENPRIISVSIHPQPSAYRFGRDVTIADRLSDEHARWESELERAKEANP